MAITEVNMLLCDRVTREQGTNKMLLMGVFDTVIVSRFPGTLTCTLFMRFYHDEPARRMDVSLTLQRPNGSRELMPVQSIPCHGGRSEGSVAFQGMPLHMPGRHFFALAIAGVEVGRVRFEVKPAPEAPRVSTPDSAN